MAKGNYNLLPGQGLLFNTNKRSDNFPDFKGEIRTPRGEVLEISAWYKTTKNIDTNYLSIKLKTTDNSHEKAPVNDFDNE